MRVVGVVSVVAVVAVLAVGACDGGGSNSTTTTAMPGAESTLPIPAASPPPSTLQIRAVLGEAAECPPVQENPPADQPTAMLRTNQCLSLAPAALVVRKADVIAVQTAGGPAVRLTLHGDDVKTFADLSKDYVGKTLALVAFGRVMALPRLGQQVVDGRLEITGLTQNEAADLKAALR